MRFTGAAYRAPLGEVRYREAYENCPSVLPSPGRRQAWLPCLSLCVSLAAQTMPPLKRQPTPAKVVEEHMAAFSSCDWPRLMAQFPENVEFFGPNGQVVRGKTALGQMFAQVVKPPSQGGTCGLKVVAEHTFVVGDTINVQWRADSPLLKEPYRGADAYETHDGLMAAQVTTWNPASLEVESTSHCFSLIALSASLPR